MRYRRVHRHVDRRIGRDILVGLRVRKRGIRMHFCTVVFSAVAEPIVFELQNHRHHFSSFWADVDRDQN